MIENNNLYEEFFKSINFIFPTEITKENAKNSFINLINLNPGEYNKKKAKKQSTNSGTDNQNTTPNNSKELSSSSETISNKKENYYNSDNPSNNPMNQIRGENMNKIKISKPKSDNEKEKIENIRFGQHQGFSFFESFSRELIFQIFGYHETFFFDYEITGEELAMNKEDKKTEKYIGNDKNGKNLRKEGQIGKDQEEIKSDKAKEGKEKDKEIQNSSNNSQIKIGNKKHKKNPEKKVVIKGDIDFLIPDLKPDELNKILNNKQYTPFIFFGNIKKGVNSDLLGEIKENFLTSDKNNIDQLNKFWKIFDLSETNERISEKFGLKKANQKIIVYVFNHSYSEYLKKMLLFESHSKKFLELNESPQAKNLCDLYTKKYKEEKSQNTLKQNIFKPDLIKTIVFSNKPYIFFFIQDLFTLFSQMKNEIQEKQKQIKEEPKEKNQENDKEKNEESNNENQMIKGVRKEEDKKEKPIESEMAKNIREIKNILGFFFLILIFLNILILFKIK